MDFLKKYRRYSELVLGFLAFGLGQRLLGTGVLRPWAEERQFSLNLGVIGSVLFIGGIILLTHLLSWLLRNYNQDNRILKVLVRALLVSITVGFLFGLLGEFLYDYTSISYQFVKNVIWILSSLIQASIKITVLYSLITFYKGKGLSFKEKEFRNLLLFALLIIGLVSICSLLLPQLAEVLLFVADNFLVLGTVYYFVIKEKI